MDRFDDCKSADALVARSQEVIRDLIPWDADWAKEIKAADADGWLVGSVTPTVRASTGRLPSGRVVMPLGDTAISMDPIAGQGANLGNKGARHLVEAIAKHPDATFDETWMSVVGEAFWADHGAKTVQFTNVLLEPLTPAGKLIMISQYGSDGASVTPQQRIADAVVENFMDPRKYTDAFVDKVAARALVASATGSGWRRHFVGGALRVDGNQIGRVFGAS
jgi:hypothetical protein